MSNEFYKALLLAAKAHKGQLRDNGEPYLCHLIRVAHSVSKYGDPDLEVIALLHDIVEDTPITLQDIEDRFSHRVSEAVFWLTHEDETYKAYIEALVVWEDARRVKIADLLDNMRDLPQESSIMGRYVAALQVCLQHESITI